MKSKDEFREDVYRRFDEYKKNKEKKRRAALKYGGIAFSALSVIALLIWPGIGIVENVWNRDYAVDKVQTGGTVINSAMDVDHTGESFSEAVSSFDGDATTEGFKTGETSIAYSTAATSVASIEKTTEATTAAFTEATAATVAATEETVVTAGSTTAATTAAYTEATMEATTAAYTEATMEATTAASTEATEATLATGEEVTIVYESKYGVTVNGADIIEAGYFPHDSNELMNMISANADKGGGVIIIPDHAENVVVYAFFVNGTASLKTMEKTHGEINSYKYVIEIQGGEEVNMYLCYFDSECAVEVNIIK
ncbi:MAG: hypothetical protein J5860_03045 [Clostridia bacterium]|nr:hypothetical protein [Clostridia bacterium]